MVVTGVDTPTPKLGGEPWEEKGKKKKRKCEEEGVWRGKECGEEEDKKKKENRED